MVLFHGPRAEHQPAGTKLRATGKGPESANQNQETKLFNFNDAWNDSKNLKDDICPSRKIEKLN